MSTVSFAAIHEPYRSRPSCACLYDVLAVEVFAVQTATTWNSLPPTDAVSGTKKSMGSPISGAAASVAPVYEKTPTPRLVTELANQRRDVGCLSPPKST